MNAAQKLAAEYRSRTVSISITNGLASFPDGSTVAATVEQIKALPDLLAALRECHDEADHQLNTDCGQTMNVVLADARRIKAICKTAIAKGTR